MISLPARYANVLGTLAGGGMSDTLLCKDAHLKRKVVIKSLKPGIAAHRLMDELSALSAIRSNHVVQVLDVIRDAKGEIVGFVEEYIDGVPLACTPKPSDAEAALKRLYPIAAGIADIHRHKRVHRDLKPDNMRVDGEGTLKIFDFGLAKLDEDAATSQLYFTTGYAAPELFKENAAGHHEFDSAVDVFAFGATALWLIDEGKLPLELHEIPPKLPCVDFHKHCLGAVPVVANLLNACLHPDPTMRPSMDEVKRTIGKHLLLDKHKMLLTHAGTEYRLDATKRKVSLSWGGSILQVIYDGLNFVVSSISGLALVNNAAVSKGYIFIGSAVIVLGTPPQGRASITADVSHPEVML